VSVTLEMQGGPIMKSTGNKACDVA
jgi:hypothetical protein